MQPRETTEVACRRIHRWVFLWVDREREQLPVEPVQRHFEECPQCRQRALEVEKAVLMLRSRCQRATVPERLAARIRRLLEDT